MQSMHRRKEKLALETPKTYTRAIVHVLGVPRGLPISLAMIRISITPAAFDALAAMRGSDCA
jgi:hypothetical protein